MSVFCEKNGTEQYCMATTRYDDDEGSGKPGH